MDKIKIIREALEDVSIWVKSLREAIDSGNPQWFFLDARMQSLEGWLRTDRAEALQALAELEQPTVNDGLLKEIDDRIVKLNNLMDDYPSQEMQYSTELFLLQRCKTALSQVKPTVNGGLEILDKIDGWIKSNTRMWTVAYKGFVHVEEVQDYMNWLREQGKQLSQVKPSVWKKYPDEKPEQGSNIVTYATSGIWIFCDFDGTAIEDGEMWCYEADLIKTIKE